MTIRPSQKVQDAVRSLGSNAAFKEFTAFLTLCSREADEHAVYNSISNDVHRGRAQAYRELLSVIHKPSL